MQVFVRRATCKIIMTAFLLTYSASSAVSQKLDGANFSELPADSSIGITKPERKSVADLQHDHRGCARDANDNFRVYVSCMKRQDYRIDVFGPDRSRIDVARLTGQSLPPAIPAPPSPSAPGNATSEPLLPARVRDEPRAAALRTATRIALVIGNDHYDNLPTLHLSVADATAIAAALRDRGFKLIGGGAQLNVSSIQFRGLIDATVAAIRANPGSIVTVFFAGHGFSDRGLNYLAPIDAVPSAQASTRSVGTAEIARRLSAAGSGLTLMLLDACREYEVGHGSGLDEEQVPDHTFLGFATLFGNFVREPPSSATAGYDYYTSAILQALDAGADNLDDFHLVVASHVVAATQGQQMPVYRHGGRMPVAPVRLAANDAQSVYSRLQQQSGGAVDTSAARCVALSDLRLFIGGENVKVGPYRLGPPAEPIDIASIVQTCRAAAAAGHRETAVLRGQAFGEILRVVRLGESRSTADGSKALALLAEAAEAGDAYSNLVLASAQTIGIPIHTIRDRLVRAAKQHDQTITGIVGLMLWQPGAAAMRTKYGLPRDPDLGVQLFRQAVAGGDPLMQFVAIQMRSRNDPAVAGLDLRGALRRALASSNPLGYYVEGFTVHQTLYLLALDDAYNGTLGPKDDALVVRLVLEAEPFIRELGLAYAREGGRDNPADSLVTGAACQLASPTPVPGVVGNRSVALRLLHKISGDPGPVAQTRSAAIMAGGACRQ